MTQFHFLSRLLCISLLILITGNISAQLKFSINGHVDNSAGKYSKNNINDSDIVVLDISNLSRKDTIRIANNSFHYEAEVPYPSIAMLNYKYGGSLILLDNSTYDFNLTLVKVDSIHWQYDGDVTSASPFFKARNDFFAQKSPLVQERDKLTNAAQHCTDADSSLYYAFTIKAINKRIIAVYHQLAADHPNSYIAAYLLQAAPDFSYENYIDIYNAFSDDIKDSYYGKNFYSRMIATKGENMAGQPKTVAGMFPVTSSIDTALNKIILDKTFFSKHQYTLIEFWASWSTPCRKVNEDLKKLAPVFKKKDVAVIGFSLDRTSVDWKMALIKDQTPWLQLSDLKAVDSPLAEYLKLTVIPANVLVDRNGKIVRTNIYDKELDGFLKGAAK